MPDRSDEYRKAASECLYLARTTLDAATRAALLTMAQRWFDFANGTTGQADLNAALASFNEQQMASKPAVQQQQQIQRKKSEE